MGGAGGGMQVSPLPSRWAGLPRARLRPRGAGAGKGSKEGEGPSGELLPITKAAVSGRGEEEPERVWAGEDVGSGARSKRRHEGGAAAGRAVTEAALAGLKQSLGKVLFRPYPAPAPCKRSAVRKPLCPGDCSTCASCFARAFPT